MDGYIQQPAWTQYAATQKEEQPREVSQWLSVSGDIDDFIYYGEDAGHSER